jgi:hypothetical protein
MKTKKNSFFFKKHNSASITNNTLNYENQVGVCLLSPNAKLSRGRLFINLFGFFIMNGKVNKLISLCILLSFVLTLKIMKLKIAVSIQY